MRYLGIDYGHKKVGLALSDERGVMAFPLLVLENNHTLLDEVESIINERQVKEIVIGHSLDKNQQANPIQEDIEAFMTDLTLATGLPIHLEPEQFTTQAAMREQGRNELTDASAAALILDSYLKRNR